MLDDTQELSTVQRRMEALTTVRRIVHAIWVISRAQYARALRVTTESVAYYKWVDEAVARLAGPAAPAGRSQLCVFLGPERALCGPLAARVAAAVQESVAQGQAYALVGSRLSEDASLATGARFCAPSVSNPQDIESVADDLSLRISSAAQGQGVELVFPVSAGGALHREHLLAVHRLAAPELSFQTYSDPATLLAATLEQALSGRVAHALAQVVQAELEARIQLTQRATKHCDEQLSELERLARVLHKEEITRELGEIVTARLSRQ